MDFLTLHELSLHLDVSVRVLRSRLRQFLLAGKLVENRDCRRDDYVDETHFVWRIDPVAFTRATGLRSVSQPDTRAAAPDTQSVNRPRSSATAPTDRPTETLIKVDSPSPSLEREMITLLKEQVRVKDVQIADLNEQNKSLNSLHLKLTGQIVQQADRIQNLLRLTGGKLDLAESVNRSVDDGRPVASQSGHLDNASDIPFGNQPADSVPEEGSARAA